MTIAANETPVAKGTPAIPQWIQADLFEPTFRKIYPDFRQTKVFEAKPALGAGENYATIMLKVTAEVELKDGSSQSVSLMLKTAQTSEVFEKMRQNYDVFEIEADMYNEVVPEMEEMYKNVGVNVKFGAESYKLETDQRYILLEDLTRRNFKNMNRLEGLDLEHTCGVLEKLAQWHAASAARVATKGLYKPSIHVGMFKKSSRPMMQAMFKPLADAFLKCAEDLVTPECHAKMCAYQPKVLDALFEPPIDADEFVVLNHGDCWANNIMFRHDEQGRLLETYLVDYQLPAYTSPAKDLFYFLLSSTSYEIKLKHFDYFIYHYHQQLEKHLKLLNYPKKIPSLKDMHILLLKHNAWSYSSVNGIMSIVLLDPEEGANMDNIVGNKDFSMRMFKNPRYQKHLKMLLPWLYNRGVME